MMNKDDTICHIHLCRDITYSKICDKFTYDNTIKILHVDMKFGDVFSTSVEILTIIVYANKEIFKDE